MKEFLSQKWVEIVSALVVFAMISWAWNDKVPFLQSYSCVLGALFVYYYRLSWKNDKETKDAKSTEEKDKAFEELVNLVAEQNEVIAEYEEIFDNQLVELPCVCGGNTFQGLFSPKTENIVECEKCKNKYRVTIDYNSVLITEPLDINQKFDDLVGKL